MKTLKDLVSLQPLTGEDDMTIIKRWFVENNLEQEGLSLIPALAQAQTAKIQRKYDFALTWVPTTVDLTECIKEKEAAKKLNKLQTLAALNYPLQENDELLVWARENIHNKMKPPYIFFRPTIVYLMKYGVEFVMSEEDKKWAIQQAGGMYE